MLLPRLQKGFTLIELLIVIAIIGILSGFAMVSVQGNLQKARNAQRRNDLKQIQTALQAYYNDHGQYPVVGTWQGATAFYGNTNTTSTGLSTDWIPGLVPQYLPRLPIDPQNGKGNTSRNVNVDCQGTNAGACQQCPNNPTWNTYLYYSNGTDYKLLAHCSPEGPLNSSNDALYDTSRPSYAWQVSSSGTSYFW